MSFESKPVTFLCFCSSSSSLESFYECEFFVTLVSKTCLFYYFHHFNISSQAMSARQLWCETRWQIFAWDDETKLILLRLRLIFVSQQLNFLFLTPLASHQKRRFASKFVWTVLDDVTAQCSCPPRTCRLLAIFSLTVSLRWANSLPISLSLL